MRKRNPLDKLVGVATKSGRPIQKRSRKVVPFYSAFQPGTVVRLSGERGFYYSVVLSEKEATEAKGLEWTAIHSAEVRSGISFYSTTAASAFNPPPYKISASLGTTSEYLPLNPEYEINHLRDARSAQRGHDSMELTDKLLFNLISGLERFVSAQH